MSTVSFFNYEIPSLQILIKDWSFLMSHSLFCFPDGSFTLSFYKKCLNPFSSIFFSCLWDMITRGNAVQYWHLPNASGEHYAIYQHLLLTWLSCREENSIDLGNSWRKHEEMMESSALFSLKNIFFLQLGKIRVQKSSKTKRNLESSKQNTCAPNHFHDILLRLIINLKCHIRICNPQ